MSNDARSADWFLEHMGTDPKRLAEALATAHDDTGRWVASCVEAQMALSALVAALDEEQGKRLDRVLHYGGTVDAYKRAKTLLAKL